MATRTVIGTILNHQEQPVPNAAVLFRPIRGTYDLEASYTVADVTGTTDEEGAISVALHANQRYKVIEPGGTSYLITVPTGTGDLSLEALRAASNVMPEEIDNVGIVVAAALEDLELDDLANVETGAKEDGDALVWDAATEKWIPGSVASGEVAWGDIADTPTTLAGYGITDAAASDHSHAWGAITGKPTDLAGYGVLDEVDTVINDALNTLDIADMNDAVILDPQPGNVLWYSTGKWRNEALVWGLVGGKPTTLAGYGLATEVDALLDGYIPLPAAPDSGDVLTWNGSAWVASAPSGGGGVSFPLLASGGTAGAPDYSWDGDPDTGMYRSGANEISFALGGVQRAKMTTSRLTIVPVDGSIDVGTTAGTLLLGGKSALNNVGGVNTLRIGQGFNNAVISVPFSVEASGAATAAPVNVLGLAASSTGTPGNGFGGRIYIDGESSAGFNGMMYLDAIWNDATTASRKADAVLSLLDYAGTREIWRGRANGSAPAIGFLGATPIARPTVTGSAGGNAALASLLTHLESLGLITDSSS